MESEELLHLPDILQDTKTWTQSVDLHLKDIVPDRCEQCSNNAAGMDTENVGNSFQATASRQTEKRESAAGQVGDMPLPLPGDTIVHHNIQPPGLAQPEDSKIQHSLEYGYSPTRWRPGAPSGIITQEKSGLHHKIPQHHQHHHHHQHRGHCSIHQNSHRGTGTSRCVFHVYAITLAILSVILTLPAVSATWITEPQDTSVDLGGTARLYCRANNGDQRTFFWSMIYEDNTVVKLFIDGAPWGDSIPPNLESPTVENGYDLLITNAVEDNDKRYECAVSAASGVPGQGTRGNLEATVQLTVLGECCICYQLISF